MNKPLHFAIVGAGSIAETHARAIATIPEARLVAAFGGGHLREFADRHKIDAARSLKALLARDEIDVVCITTPSGAHAEAAIAALRAGKHVLCEKPLEVTTAGVDAMLAAARDSGKILAAVFQSRFGEGARKVKRAIEEQRFGRLTMCSAYVKWWRTQEYYDSGAWRGTWKLDGGGALMNQGIHAIDLLQWFAGVPVEVTAFTTALAHERIEVEDTASASLRFANGALGVIEGSTACYPGWRKRIEVSGNKGSVVLEDDQIKFWQFAEEQRGDAEIRKQSSESDIGGGAADPKAINAEGHRRQIQDLCIAIQTGAQPAVTAADAGHSVAIVCAIYESARIGKPVKIPSCPSL